MAKLRSQVDVDAAMKRWESAIEKSKECGRNVREKGLRGEEAMRQYLVCRIGA